MLGDLFPNTFGGVGDNKNTSLASGAQPGELRGNESEMIKKASSLPEKSTPSEVKRTAKEAGVLQAQVPVLEQLSKHKIAMADSALAVLGIRVKHSKEMQKREAQYQEKLSEHGKNILAHNLETEATQAHFSGYEATFAAAKDVINF